VKSRVLICGAQLVQDKVLLRILKPKMDTLSLEKKNRIETSIQAQHIDMIILELPKILKKDLILIQKVKAKWPDIPVIVVEEEESRESVIECFKCGVDDYFRKPYKPDLLAERVEALLKRRIKQ